MYVHVKRIGNFRHKKAQRHSANRFRRGSVSEYTRTAWAFTEAIYTRHSELEATETFRIESFIFSSVMTHGHAYVAVLEGVGMD